MSEWKVGTFVAVVHSYNFVDGKYEVVRTTAKKVVLSDGSEWCSTGRSYGSSRDPYPRITPWTQELQAQWDLQRVKSGVLRSWDKTYKKLNSLTLEQLRVILEALQKVLKEVASD